LARSAADFPPGIAYRPARKFEGPLPPRVMCGHIPTPWNEAQAVDLIECASFNLI
jgi:hypothetical protein